LRQIKKYYLTLNEFIEVMNKQYFPKITLQEINKIPLYNLTENSFKMLLYPNLSQFYTEDDYFLKFSEIKSNELSSFNRKKRKSKQNKNKSYCSY